ncbi:MAG: DegT/DnrJ/EryC1/StrS family aminotransferase [bacterium]|nr:DegT/DnrJ/EryC1/StrS family aminotransferase [bacterium]
MSEKLAIYGGPKTRERNFTTWPVFGNEEEKAVHDVLQSGKWGRLEGNKTEKFEKAFAEFHGCKYGIAVFNGTVALQLALLAAGIDEGDEVIVPAYTFLATASSVMLCNATPVFIDIHPETLCIDSDKIVDAITHHTKAIIPVHLGGLPAEMDKIMTIAQEYNLTVIEDCAHAHGAEYKNKRVGSIGHMGCFSFQSSKNLTSGEGGIVTTNDKNLYATCLSMHNCGRVPEGAWYDHRALSMNLRITEFQTALLSCGLDRLDTQTDIRDANGIYLNEKLSAIPGIDPITREHGETRHGYHLYMFRYNPKAFNGISRKYFLEILNAEGIPSETGYDMPLYKQRIFQDKVFGPYIGFRKIRPDIDYSTVDCPVCEQTCLEVCYIKHAVLLGTREDMDDIVSAIQKIYDNSDNIKN